MAFTLGANAKIFQKKKKTKNVYENPLGETLKRTILHSIILHCKGLKNYLEKCRQLSYMENLALGFSYSQL